MALTSQQSELVKLYVAGFLRAPEKGGFEYWSSLLNAGKSVGELAESIFSLSIVKQIYPDSLINSEFVTRIYNNVFNKDPDSDGLDYWAGKLDSGLNRGQLVLDMINAGLNVADGTPGKAYIVNRVAVAGYEAETQVLQQKEIAPDTLKTILAQVTENASSVTLAQSTTNTELAKIASVVGEAFANEVIGAAIRWQIDRGQYTADGLDALDLQTGATHIAYMDMFSFDFHPEVAQTTPGYLTVQLYGDNNHNWKLTAQDVVDFSKALAEDQYVTRALTYSETGNLDAYIQDTQASAAVYDQLIAQGPQLPAYWF